MAESGMAAQLVLVFVQIWQNFLPLQASYTCGGLDNLGTYSLACYLTLFAQNFVIFLWFVGIIP